MMEKMPDVLGKIRWIIVGKKYLFPFSIGWNRVNPKCPSETA
jgi:hypothetical protein